MAKFDSGAAVERLEYDFSAHGGPVGVVPEPSEKQVDEALAKLRDVAAKAGGDLPADASPAQVAEALGNFSLEEQAGPMTEAVAGLCSGSPSYDELMALPMRVRAVFRDWLLGELTDPTESRPATRR